MSNFAISGKLTRHKDVVIRAATRQEAVEKFMYRHPSYQIQSVADEEPLGYCEVSGKAIFEGDKYAMDIEGVMWLLDEPKDECI